MLGLIQRVSAATVVVDQRVVGEINQGILLFLGVQKGDGALEADRLFQKILNYRLFPDSAGKMNLSLLDINGGLLVVPQFTLAADTKKGLRPSFSSAAPPGLAEQLYDYFLNQASAHHTSVQSGQFGANMQVSLCNDGPVTFMLQS